MGWKRRYSLFVGILALILVLMVDIAPALSKQSQFNFGSGGSSPGLVQPGMMMAARGCEGAQSAKTNLKTAIDKLSGVRNESKNLRRALDATRTALEEVNIHLQDKRC